MGKKSEKSRGKLTINKRNELKILSDAILIKSKDSNAEFDNFNDIYNLLERIIKIESDIKCPFKSIRSQKSIDNFIAWCHQEGAKFDNIELKNVQEFELGLVAKKKFVKGDIFIEIPENMIFSYNKIENNIPEVLKKKVFAECPLLENKSNLRLTLALMIERMNPFSRFKAYFDVLPNKFTTALYFTPSDMKELLGTTALASAVNQIKFIASQYAFLYKYLMISAENEPILEEFRDNFTYEFYRWAVSCVMTRQNIIANESCCLIPGWDFSNHTNGNINTQYNVETNQIESFCMKDFEIGEQVTIAYGNRSNLDFLVHNGFVFKENENDEHSIKLHLNKKDAMYEHRHNMLKKIGLTDGGYYQIFPQYSSDLIGFIKVFNMNQEELDTWQKVDDDSVKSLLLPNFELKFLQSLLIRIKIALKLFPTDLKEDLLLLSNGNLPKIKSMLIQYRTFEKSILEKVVENLSNDIRNLTNN